MKYLLPFFLVLCSCGWFNPDKGFPDKDPVPPPPQDVVSEEDPERVVYIPYEVDVEHGYTSEESCKVEEHLEVIGPYKAETKIVNFVYGTIDFDQSIPVTRDEVRESDYIHAKQVDLYITAGEDFDFFSWVKIYLGDHLVAWGGPQRSNVRHTTLDVDGSVDLKQFWENDQVRFHGEIRGRIPKKDTWVKGEILFVRFYDCE